MHIEIEIYDFWSTKLRYIHDQNFGKDIYAWQYPIINLSYDYNRSFTLPTTHMARQAQRQRVAVGKSLRDCVNILSTRNKHGNEFSFKPPFINFILEHDSKENDIR